MISRVLYALQDGLTYIRQHPNVLAPLLLVVFVPLLFLYTGEQFLAAGRSNQDQLQQSRIGLMHDMFVTVMETSKYDPTIMQREIDYIASLNTDITAFRVTKYADGTFTPVAALDTEKIGVAEEDTGLFQASAVRTDESIIFPTVRSGERHWQTFRTVAAGDTTYVIFVEFSLEQIDSLLAGKEHVAYATLGIVYLVVVLIALWHVRLTDYRYLYREAQKANETKDLFTNMIAHELRAPLTAIFGYADMLVDSKKLSGLELQYANRARTASERVLALVNDMLDVARIQSGKMRMETATTDLVPLVQSVVDELTGTIGEQQIKLLVEGTQKAVFAPVDPKRMQQVLINIVNNAIKYTKEGTVTIALTESKRSVEIRIKDTGMGIHAADQKKLFEPFYRAQKEDVSTITGSGLGMWITRQFVERMGGTIGVESIKDVGTHIVITLPKAA